MKKFLTILTLALALCLVCGMALAESKVQHHQSGVLITYNVVDGDCDTLTIEPDPDSDLLYEGTVALTVDKVSMVVAEPNSAAWQDSITYTHNELKKVEDCVVDGITFHVKYNGADGKPYVRAYGLYFVKDANSGDMMPVWDHEWVKGDLVKEATCTSYAVYVWKCEVCGKVEQREDVAAGKAPHNYLQIITEQPTCIKDGKAKLECSVCHQTDGKEYTVSAGGHNFKLNMTAPVCDAKTKEIILGKAYVQCEDCGAYVKLDANGTLSAWLEHDKIAEIETTRVLAEAVEMGITEERYNEINGVPKTSPLYYYAHDWSPWNTVQPTCWAAGYKIHYCNRCGFDETQKGADPKTPDWYVKPLNEKGYTCIAEYGKDFIIVCKNCDGKAPGHAFEAIGTTSTADATGRTYNLAETKTTDVMDSYIRLAYTITVASGRPIITYPVVVEHLLSHVYLYTKDYLLLDKDSTKTPKDPYITQVTCVENSYKYYRCVNDSKDLKYYQDFDAKANHPLYPVVVTPATGHNWGEWKMMEAPDPAKNIQGRWVRTCKNEFCLDTTGTQHAQEEYKSVIAPCLTEADHVWAEKVVTEATCTVNGLKAIVCTKCNKIKDGTDEPIPAGHTWGEMEVLTAPKCEAIGVGVVTCSKCGIIEKRDIPATGHTPVDVAEVPATCIKEGTKAGKKCSVCDKELEGFEVIEKAAHKYGEAEVLTAATCEMEGVGVKTCSVCGNITKEAIPATGHKAVDVEEVPATCKTEGKKAGKKCEVCGKELEGFEAIPVDETKHVWDVEKVLAPTCTADGYDLKTCKECGKIEKAVVAALGHTWDKGVVSKEATKEEKGDMTYTCTVCGETKVEEGVVDYVVTAAPKYEVTELNYNGQTVTGKVVHVEDTLEADKLNIRVTFFLAGNYYMATIGEIAEDGTFSVDGVGPIEYISLVVSGSSSVNPDDVISLGTGEIFVK